MFLKDLKDTFKWKFKSQQEEVLYLLQTNKSVSSCVFAMERGILRYSVHIFNLRKEGYEIKMDYEWVTLKNWRKQKKTTYSLLNKKR